MTEEEIGRKAAQLLDRGLDDIKQSTLSRLQSVRRAALENYQVADEVISVTHAGSARIHGGHHSRAGARQARATGATDQQYRQLRYPC